MRSDGNPLLGATRWRRLRTKGSRCSARRCPAGFPERELWNIYRVISGSLQLSTRKLHHLTPLLSFFSDELTEVCGRTCKHCVAHVGKPRLHLGIGKAVIDLLVELVDDL